MNVATVKIHPCLQPLWRHTRTQCIEIPLDRFFPAEAEKREESKCWCFAVTGEERDGSPTVREGLPLLRGSLISNPATKLSCKRSRGSQNIFNFYPLWGDHSSPTPLKNWAARGSQNIFSFSLCEWCTHLKSHCYKRLTEVLVVWKKVFGKYRRFSKMLTISEGVLIIRLCRPLSFQFLPPPAADVGSFVSKLASDIFLWVDSLTRCSTFSNIF